MRLIFAMPAYEEAGNLPRLLPAIQKAARDSGRGLAVVVCDDGSRDGTAEILEEWRARMPLEVVTHPVNEGYGAAMRDVLWAALEESREGDVIVTLDADATQDPCYAASLAEAIEAGADVVIASRYAEGAAQQGTSELRRFLSRGAGLLLSVAFPTPHVRDYSCGFRAMDADFLARAKEAFGGELIHEPGFAATPELLLMLRAAGARFAEVPFTLRYDAKEGASKIRIWRTIRQYVGLIWRLVTRRPVMKPLAPRGSGLPPEETK
jgi:dolichol-phosphate mannosyltransferase